MREQKRLDVVHFVDMNGDVRGDWRRHGMMMLMMLMWQMMLMLMMVMVMIIITIMIKVSRLISRA